MGVRILDQYSILHFAVGIIGYFLSFSFFTVIIFNIFFEFIENTEVGMYFINTYITRWPGGKPRLDNLLNSISDIVFVGIGWIVSYYLDIYRFPSDAS